MKDLTANGAPLVVNALVVWAAGVFHARVHGTWKLPRLMGALVGNSLASKAKGNSPSEGSPHVEQSTVRGSHLGLCLRRMGKSTKARGVFAIFILKSKLNGYI